MKNQPRRRSLRWSSACASLVFLGLFSAGCTGYRLGSTLPSDIHSLCVPVFVNQANYPQLEQETTRAAIQEFQKDGTLRVLPRASADLLLEVTLKKYALTPLRYQKDNNVTPNEYRITITALLTLKRRATDEVMLNGVEVIGESTFVLTTDIGAAQRQSLPAAARDLGYHIVESVVEYW